MSDANPKATIVLDGDASGLQTAVYAAEKSIAGLGKAAKLTDADMKQLGKGAGEAFDTVADKVKSADRSTKAWATQVKNSFIDIQAAGQSLSVKYELKAISKGIDPAIYAPYVAQLKAVEAAQAAAAASAVTAGNAMSKAIVPRLNEIGMTAKGTAAALRNVPAQFTDIIVSLQGGQAPLTVLLQQGGQLKDMFGGVGGAAKALGGYIAGLVTPFTVAAATIGTLGFAYLQGAKEGEAYNKALILTGNNAGTTAGQLSAMAVAVSQATGGTIGAAADALAQLAGSGNIAAAQFERIAAVAIKMEKTTGVSVAETVKQFSELGKDPLKASLKLDESTHFLTLSVYEQIKALEEQGRTLEAGVVAQNAWAGVADQRTKELTANLGIAESAWNGLMGAAKKAWDAMLGLGRDAKPEEKIYTALEAARARLALMQDPNYRETQNFGAAQAPTMVAVDAQKTLVADLAEQAKLLDMSAASHAQIERSKQAQIAADKEHDKYLSKSVRMEQELAVAVEKYANVDMAHGDNLKNYTETLKGIQDKFKEPAGRKAAREVDHYAGILTSIEKFNEAALIELENNRKLTESEKFRVKTMADISAEMEKQLKLAGGDKRKISIALDLAVNAENEMNNAVLNKATQELRVGAAEAAKEALKDSVALTTVEAKRITQLHAGQKTIEDFVTATNEASDAIKYEAEITGLSAENQKIAIEQYKLAIELRKELSKIELSSQFSGDETGAREKAKADMTAAYAVKASNAAKRIQLDSQQKTVDQYESIFQKGFVDMVNGGKDTWGSFTTSLATTFKTSVADQIYKTFAQPFVVQIVASMVGLVNTVGNAVGMGSTGGSLMSGVNAASSANSAYNMYNGGYSAGYASFATSAAGQSMGLGTAATEGFSYGAGAGFAGAEVSGSAASMTSLGSSIGTAIPYIGAFIGAVMIASQMGPTSAQTLGSSKASYGADGKLIGTEALDGLVHRPSDQVRSDIAKEQTSPTPWSYDVNKMGSQESPWATLDRELTSSLAFEKISTGADVQAKNLAELYFNAAKTLDIKAAAASFSFASNTGQSGEHPNASFGVQIGDKSYNSGEAAFADPEVVKLAASRTILEALKASELPKYLTGVFDGLTTSTATQAQIDDTINLAQSYKVLHDQLQLLPFEYLKDMSFKAADGLVAAAGSMENLGSMLGNYMDAFYSDEEKRALSIKNTTEAFSKLGIVMPALDESARAWYRSEVDRLGAMDMSVAANAKAYTGVLSLSGAMNTLSGAMNTLVPAAEAAAMSAEKLASSFTSALSGAQSDLLSANKANYDMQIQAAEAAESAAQNIRDAMAAAGGTISDFISSLRNGSVGVSSNPFNATQSAYQSDLLLAKNGSVDASGRIASSGRSYLDAQINNSATSADAAFATAKMAAELSALPAVASYQEQLLAAVKGTTGAVVDLHGKFMAELTVSARSEIVKMINFVAASDSMTSEEKQLALLATGGVSRVIGLSASSLISDADQQLALMTAGTIAKYIDVSLGKSDQAAIGIAFAQSSTIEKIIKASGGILSDDQARLLDGVSTYNKNVVLDFVVKDGALSAVQTLLQSTFGSMDLGAIGASSGAGGATLDGLFGTVQTSRWSRIADYMKLFDWSSSDAATAASAQKLYSEIGTTGIKQSDLAVVTHQTEAEIKAFFDAYNIPMFAKGTNFLPEDMMAQVHQGERIIPAADNRELMARLSSPSGNNEVLVAEIRNLREDNAAQARAMVQLQQRLTKLMERWDGSGMPETRVVA